MEFMILESSLSHTFVLVVNKILTDIMENVIDKTTVTSNDASVKAILDAKVDSFLKTVMNADETKSYFHIGKSNNYDYVTGINPDGEECPVRLSDLRVNTVQAIAKKLGIARCNKADALVAIDQALKTATGFTKLSTKVVEKTQQSGKMLIRLISVLFGNTRFREKYADKTKRKTRNEFEVRDTLYKDLSDIVNNNIAEEHDNVLPCESVTYAEEYNEYMIQKFDIQDPQYPSGPLEELTNASTIEVALTDLTKVWNVMIDNTNASGAHTRDPMNYTSAAISKAIKSNKIKTKISPLAAFYFFVMCDAYQDVARSISREISETIKGNSSSSFTIAMPDREAKKAKSTSSKALPKNKPPPYKSSETTGSSNYYELQLLRDTHSSSEKVSYGNRINDMEKVVNEKVSLISQQQRIQEEIITKMGKVPEGGPIYKHYEKALDTSHSVVEDLRSESKILRQDISKMHKTEEVLLVGTLTKAAPRSITPRNHFSNDSDDDDQVTTKRKSKTGCHPTEVIHLASPASGLYSDDEE